MNTQPTIPDAETRARSVARLRELVQRMDKHIAELDALNARLEEENRQSFEQARQTGNARRKAVQDRVGLE